MAFKASRNVTGLRTTPTGQPCGHRCFTSHSRSAFTVHAVKESFTPRDVRSVPIKIVTVSKDNSKGAQLMAQEWSAKISRYTSISTTSIKPNPLKSNSPDIQKQAEAQKVLKTITPTEHVILLDERGRELSSYDFADIIAKAGDDGTPLTFCIGGPYGHGDAVRSRANDSIRLSRLVLNHQVAVVVLLEQLYRGWAIVRGEPYHHV